MAPPMTTKAGQPLNKEQLDSLLKRRMFFTPAFEIHGAVKGLFGTLTQLTLHGRMYEAKQKLIIA